MLEEKWLSILENVRKRLRCSGLLYLSFMVDFFLVQLAHMSGITVE